MSTVYTLSSSLIETACDSIIANELVANTPSTLVVSGTTIDGNVSYTAFFGGDHGNNITMTHEVGQTGVGSEDRSLASSVTDKAVTITFGTNGNGDSVAPTGQAIVDEISANSDLSQLVTASIQGTGLGVSSTSSSVFSGGLEDGNYYRQHKKYICKIARIETEI